MPPFDLFSLPTDVIILVISLIPEMEAIRKVDVAVCNRNCRAQYLSCIRGMELGASQWILHPYRVPRWAAQTQWILSRQLLPKSITIDLSDVIKDSSSDILHASVVAILSRVPSVKIVMPAQSRVKYVMEESGQLVTDILNLLTNVSSMICTKFDMAYGFYPWKHLSHPENLTSLKFSGKEKSLIIELHDVWEPAQGLQLKHLSIKVPDLHKRRLVSAILSLSQLEELCLVLYSPLLQEFDPLPSKEDWPSLPVLPHLKLLSLSCSNRSDPDTLLLLLLNRCPNVQSLELDECRLQLETMKEILGTFLPQLQYLHLPLSFDPHIFTLTVEAVSGSTLCDLHSQVCDVHSAASMQDLLSALLVMLSHAHLQCYECVLQQKSTAQDAADLFQPVMTMWFTALTSGALHSLTHLDLEIVCLPIQPDQWPLVFALPHLKSLALGFREGNPCISSAFGLDLCAEQNIIAHRVTSLAIVCYVLNGSAEQSDLNAALSAIFPALTELELRVNYIASEDMLLTFLHGFSHLRSISITTIYRGNSSFLQTMTTEAWHEALTRSKCRKWTISIPMYRWSDLQRMLDSTSKDHTVTVVVQKLYQVHWEHLLYDEPMCKEYLYARRFRVIYEV